MHDFLPAAIGDADRHDALHTLDDLGEVGWVQFGEGPQRRGGLPEVLNRRSFGAFRFLPMAAGDGGLHQHPHSPLRRRCRTRSRAPCGGGCRRRTTWAPEPRPGLVPSEPRAAAPRRSTEPAPSPRSRTAGCLPGRRKAAPTPHTCWSNPSYGLTLLWSKNWLIGVGEMVPDRFGRYRDLGHTVRVALSRVHAWPGIRPAPTRARPVPIWSVTNFGRGPGCVRATHPTAGAGGPRQVNSGATTGPLPDR